MTMDVTTFHHWVFRVEALTRQVTFIHDTVNMAAAYRNRRNNPTTPVQGDDLEKAQADLDTANYLLAEAQHHVNTNAAAFGYKGAYVS